MATLDLLATELRYVDLPAGIALREDVAAHLELVADALLAIHAVVNGDTSEGSETTSVERMLGGNKA